MPTTRREAGLAFSSASPLVHPHDNTRSSTYDGALDLGNNWQAMEFAVAESCDVPVEALDDDEFAKMLATCGTSVPPVDQCPSSRLRSDVSVAEDSTWDGETAWTADYGNVTASNLWDIGISPEECHSIFLSLHS